MMPQLMVDVSLSCQIEAAMNWLNVEVTTTLSPSSNMTKGPPSKPELMSASLFSLQMEMSLIIYYIIYYLISFNNPRVFRRKGGLRSTSVRLSTSPSVRPSTKPFNSYTIDANQTYTHDTPMQTDVGNIFNFFSDFLFRNNLDLSDLPKYTMSDNSCIFYFRIMFT